MLTEPCPPPEWLAAQEPLRDCSANTPPELPSVLEVAQPWGPSLEPPTVELARALVKAQWTLVASYEEQGSRYFVARESCTPTVARLTSRERQIVTKALRGLNNKQIAHDLGIADATVRVLMARAAGRLGVHTRAELLVHPALAELRDAAQREPAP